MRCLFAGGRDRASRGQISHGLEGVVSGEKEGEAARMGDGRSSGLHTLGSIFVIGSSAVGRRDAEHECCTTRIKV